MSHVFRRVQLEQWRARRRDIDLEGTDNNYKQDNAKSDVA